MPGEGIFDLSDRHTFSRRVHEGRHAAIADAARHDQSKVIEVGADVEGEAMARDSA